MKPEIAEFWFLDQSAGRVGIRFLRPVRNGQFSLVQVIVGDHTWEPPMKPGEFKPRITDCKKLFVRYSIVHKDLLKPVPKAKRLKVFRPKR